MDEIEPLDTPNGRDSTFFRAVVENSPEPIITVDTHGSVRHVSQAIDSLLGYDPADVTGKPLTTLVVQNGPTDDRAHRRTRYPGVDRLASGEALEFRLEHADGHAVSVSATFREHVYEGDRVFTGVLRERERGDEDGIDSRTFRNAVEHAGHAIYVTDTDGTITYVNTAFKEITGYDSEEALGKTPNILNSGEMPEEYFENLWETVRSGSVWEAELVDRRRSGELYDAHQTIAPVVDDGDVEAFVAIQTDITERKELERELRKYAEIVERIDDPIMLQDAEGTFELVNDAVPEFSGLTNEELLETSELAFMDAETAETIQEKKTEALETESPLEYEVSPTFPWLGKEATFSTKRYPYYDADGTLSGTIAVCRDVTRLKQREEDLRQYERAITEATDLICAVDDDGNYLFVNPQYCRYHGLETDAVPGITLEDVFEDEHLAAIESRIERALGGESVDHNVTRDHPTRGERSLNARYHPINDAEGSVVGVVAVLRDVTDRVMYTRQLRVIDRVLRHNLRNDLSVIRGLAEQLASSGDGPIQGTALEIVERSDGLLTTSEKSRVITTVLGDRTTTESVDAAHLARTIADSITKEYADARIEVEGSDSATVSATRHIDDALEELIRNAVDHNDSGTPTVRLRIRALEETVEIAVHDNGPGIGEMDRDVLVHGHEVDDLYHGSGLGLWLVHWIVQRSAGSIDVADRDAGGTTVTLTLPRSGQ